MPLSSSKACPKVRRPLQNPRETALTRWILPRFTVRLRMLCKNMCRRSCPPPGERGRVAVCCPSGVSSMMKMAVGRAMISTVQPSFFPMCRTVSSTR